MNKKKQYFMNYVQSGGVSPRLPSAYQEVEYIASNGASGSEAQGNQWIDTGYIPNQNTGVEYKFSYQAISTYGRRIMGILENAGTFEPGHFRTLSGSTFIAQRGGNAYSTSSISGVVDKVYTITSFKGNDNIIVDGQTITSLVWTTQTLTQPLYLFALNENGSAEYKAKATIYYVKIYENNTLVRDLVPCYRKSDGEIGLYDLVNDVFYTNQGSGSFTCGVSIIYDDTYQQVEYVGTARAGYCDMGIIPDSTTEAEYMINYDEFGTYGGHILSDSGQYFFPYYRTLNGGRWITVRNENGTEWQLTTSTNTIYTIRAFPNNYWYRNGTQIGSETMGSITSTSTLYLFNYHNSYQGYSFNGKMYFCRIWHNGALARDLVPVYRIADNEIGLLDIVNDVFYTNEGTGSFTKGGPIGYFPTSAVSFATDSWETIQAEAERISNYYEYYGRIPDNTPYGIYNPEGNDTDNIRTITLSTNETIQIAIIGMCHDTLTTAYSGGGTKAGITWQMVNCLQTTQKMNSTATNVGGYASSIPKSLMPTYLSQLPNDLQTIIKEVQKQTSAGGQSSTINTTTEKLFLLSCVECMGTTYRDTNTNYAYDGEGTQYEFYAKAPLITDTGGQTWTALFGTTGTCKSRSATYITSLGQSFNVPANYYYNYRNAKPAYYGQTSAGQWWYRSPCRNSGRFVFMGDRGDNADYPANYAFNIAYAGCI